MSFPVNEEFPDVPERCLRCPVLEKGAVFYAAAMMLGEFAQESFSAFRADEPITSPFLPSSEAEAVDRVVADFISERKNLWTDRILQAARETWENCSGERSGKIELSVVGSRIKKARRTCESSSQALRELLTETYDPDRNDD